MLELLNTIAAVGTFVVITASAIAAVVQLGHLRASNQLEGLLDVIGRLEEEKVYEWFSQMRRDLPSLLEDRNYVQSLVEGTYDRNVSWLHIGNRYERIGNLLKYKLIPADPFLDVYATVVVHTWDFLVPITAILRSRDENLWENFEYMYVRAKAFDERNPHGNYPKGVPRASIPQPRLKPAGTNDLPA